MDSVPHSDIKVLHPVQKLRYQKRFSAIEASFRIEGMDPSGDPLYEQAKELVLTGEMTPRQALEFVVLRSTNGSGDRAAN
jgi:hypothetical protein